MLWKPHTSIIKLLLIMMPILHFENYYSNTRALLPLTAPGHVTSLQLNPSSTIYGLVITWGPPSGSNYPTPVTYRVRYRERPCSGPPGSWSSTVVRNVTQREYTTPTLSQTTRYEVEVWAVTSIEEGTYTTKTASTFKRKIYIVNLNYLSTRHCVL